MRLNDDLMYGSLLMRVSSSWRFHLSGRGTSERASIGVSVGRHRAWAWGERRVKYVHGETSDFCLLLEMIYEPMVSSTAESGNACTPVDG